MSPAGEGVSKVRLEEVLYDVLADFTESKNDDVKIVEAIMEELFGPLAGEPTAEVHCKVQPPALVPRKYHAKPRGQATGLADPVIRRQAIVTALIELGVTGEATLEMAQWVETGKKQFGARLVVPRELSVEMADAPDIGGGLLWASAESDSSEPTEPTPDTGSQPNPEGMVEVAVQPDSTLPDDAEAKIRLKMTLVRRWGTTEETELGPPPAVVRDGAGDLWYRGDDGRYQYGRTGLVHTWQKLRDEHGPLTEQNEDAVPPDRMWEAGSRLPKDPPNAVQDTHDRTWVRDGENATYVLRHPTNMGLRMELTWGRLASAHGPLHTEKVEWCFGEHADDEPRLPRVYDRDGDQWVPKKSKPGWWVPAINAVVDDPQEYGGHPWRRFLESWGPVTARPRPVPKKG